MYLYTSAYLVCVFIVVVFFVSFWTSDPFISKRILEFHYTFSWLFRSMSFHSNYSYLCIPPTHPSTHTFTYTLTHSHKLTLKTLTHAHCQSLEFVYYNNNKHFARHASHLLFVFIFIHKKIIVTLCYFIIHLFWCFLFLFLKIDWSTIHRCSIASSSCVLWLSLFLFLSLQLFILYIYVCYLYFQFLAFFILCKFLSINGKRIMQSAQIISILECSIFLDVVVNRFRK